MRQTLFALILSYVLLACTTVCEAATINYGGQVYNEMGQPLVGGFVIAGSFAPQFDPARYSCFYGDSACNLDPNAFDRAVQDGNFLPAGTGGFTNAIGTFALTGDSGAPAGSPIWLFAFEDGGRNSFTQVLTTSSSPNWLLPAAFGSTSLSTAQADRFVLGRDHPNGIELSVVPFPEPGASASLILGIAACLGVGRNSRRR